MARRFAGSATPLAIDGHADDAAPMTDHAHDHGSVPQGLAEFWDDRYAGDGPIWSGRVNATLADVVTGLQPGRALDLGSGEGGDVIWLAQHGWRATGLDVSTVDVDGKAAPFERPTDADKIWVDLARPLERPIPALARLPDWFTENADPG